MKMTSDKIKDLTDRRVAELLEEDVSAKDFNKDTFDSKLAQAKLGMAYLRDREITERIHNGQVIRIIGFISTDVKEREEYVRLSMPQLLPAGGS